MLYLQIGSLRSLDFLLYMKKGCNQVKGEGLAPLDLVSCSLSCSDLEDE